MKGKDLGEKMAAQQIAISGMGGQGVLFLTKVLAECALDCELNVITSETHGMAIRGGSVISYVKVGPFRGPLIRRGKADVMLAMDESYLEASLYLVASQGIVFLNAKESPVHPCIDAMGIAAEMGAPLVANLVLLGFALKHQRLFCDYSLVEPVIKRISPLQFKDLNLKALRRGFFGKRP